MLGSASAVPRSRLLALFQSGARQMSRALAVVFFVVGFVIVGIAGFVLLSGDDTTGSRGSISACNGTATLCDRPLNDVVFPATHNSFAGADVPAFDFRSRRLGSAGGSMTGSAAS